MDHPIYPSLPVLQTDSLASDPYFIDPDFEEFANANGSLSSDVLVSEDLSSSPSFVDPDDEAVKPPAVDSGGGFNTFGFGPDQLFSDYDVAAADLPSGSGSYLSKNLGSSWPPAASILWQQQQQQQQSTGTGEDLNLLAKNSPFNNPIISSSFEFLPLSTTDSSYYHHRDDHTDEAPPDPLAQFGSLSQPPGDNSRVKRYGQVHDLSISNNLRPKAQVHKRIQNSFENAHARSRHRDAESHRQQPNIARRSHRNLAQCLDPNLLQRKRAQDGLILEAEFAAAAGTPYDPLWIEHYGLEPSQITFSPSAMKFDKLFLEKVIKVGDKLVLIPEHTPDAESITPPLRNVATVVSITRCPQHFPNLLINSCSSPSPNDEGFLIPRCAGTKQLALALIKGDSRLSAITPSRAWKHFRLCRDNVDLGTLWDVRLRYNLWIDQVDAWAVRNGQQRRQRRSPRGTNVVFQDGLFQKLVPGGGLVVCEDQHEFDAPRRRGVRRRMSAA